MEVDQIINKNIKYPKSTNNKQCVGPCYKPNTFITHPITLDYITDLDDPFCPTNIWKEKLSNGKTEDRIIDVCKKPTHETDISKKDIGMNVLIPQINFDPEEFVKYYYNLFSFEDALNWLDKNNHLPINTKIRVMDSSLMAYGKSLDIVDYRMITFFIDVIKFKWINIIYSKLNKYISIDKKNVILDKSHKMKPDDDVVIRMNYLIDLFSENELQKFFEKYIKHAIKEMNHMDINMDRIKNDLIEYFEQKINKTLE